MYFLYTRFRSVSSPLSPLLGELERRANAHPEELSALLAECHSAYFSARKGPLVSRLVEEINPGWTELVVLASYYLFFIFYCFNGDFDVCLSIQSDAIGVYLSQTVVYGICLVIRLKSDSTI
jgi:conserved oligomeric Golgi complex subunit 3